MEKPRGGGFSRTGGAEAPGGCLQRIGEFFGGGGGLNIFFRGRNVHQDPLSFWFFGFFGGEYFQWSPKYGCRGTVTARFALIAFVAWKRLADSTLGKLLVHPEYG